MYDHHDIGQESDHGASGTERTGGGRAWRVAGAGALLAYGWWAVSLPPFSAGATVAVLVAGAAAWAWGGRERHRRRPVLRGRDLAPWAIVAGAAAGWQLAGYLQSPRADHPTLSSLANAVLDSQPSRAGAFALWLAIAAGLARR